MSEPRGKTTHPDAEVLAEFRAGLVTGSHGARISAHLADCERCVGLCDQLAEISVLLAAVPAPAMPDAVTRRLEGVFAAEAAKTDDSERAVDPRSRDRTVSPRPRRHWNFRPVALRVLAPAAAAIVLAAGGYGLSRIGGSSTSSEAAGSGSTASSATAAPRAGGATVPSNAPNRASAGPAIEAPADIPPVVTSRTDYQRATLGPQLAGELRRAARHTAGPQVLASVSVQGCVVRVTQRTKPGTVKLVETARFQGQPAIVIVAVSGHHDDAWVTNADCDDILATTTVPGTSTP